MFIPYDSGTLRSVFYEYYALKNHLDTSMNKKCMNVIFSNTYLYFYVLVPNTNVVIKFQYNTFFLQTKLNVQIQGQLVFACYFVLFGTYSPTHTFTNKISNKPTVVLALKMTCNLEGPRVAEPRS